MATVKDVELSMEASWEPLNKTRTALGIKPSDRLLVVRTGRSLLQFWEQGALVKSYVVSTSKAPPSNVSGSLGTPPGLHEIADRIGAHQPPGVVFTARVPSGRHYSELPDGELGSRCLITSRILWLRGLEPGVNAGGNVDTHRRYIYLHGTQDDRRVGQPWGSGCILLRNADIVELFERVRVGDQVWITA